MKPKLSCDLEKGDTVVVDNDLRITFRRTIRVPDNDKSYQLPPDLGTFPLERVPNYYNTLPDSMIEKGGMFFPMHQREAMWIKFESRKPYMIEIYVGGVNAVSGASPVETFTTKLQQIHRLNGTQTTTERLRKLQDYIVVPSQAWLDGIANADGTVRQFVAMSFGSGHSVEAQATRQEVAGGLQFEITPIELTGDLIIFIKR